MSKLTYDQAVASVEVILNASEFKAKAEKLIEQCYLVAANEEAVRRSEALDKLVEEGLITSYKFTIKPFEFNTSVHYVFDDTEEESN